MSLPQTQPGSVGRGPAAKTCPSRAADGRTPGELGGNSTSAADGAATGVAAPRLC
jgi:hypothetical protein